MTERKDRRTDAPNRNAATCLALAALIACALGFVAFTAVILPRIRGVILVIAGLSAFFLLHYLTWGRWMSQMRDQEDEEAPPMMDDR